ncbi:unnamed protein product [Camellia sinensis]
MDSLISTSLPIFTGELTSDFMAKDSYVLLSYHAWTFRLSDARKQLEQVPGLVESMASLMCVDIDFNLDAQEVVDDSGGRGSDVNVTKLNVVEIVETKIRNAKEEGDDTMKWLELEDLHMDDALLLSLDLPSKFLEKERSKMAAPVVISAAQVILNNFIPFASEQVKLEWGFKEDLETLRRRLTLIQSLLSDAENQRITSASMREWLKNLKLVTCDAENVLDEFAYEALRRKLEVKNRMRNKLVYKNKKVVKYFGDQRICSEAETTATTAKAATVRSSTRSFGFSSCVSAEFTACQQYNQLVQAINNQCREKRFEQEAINLTMNLPQHSTWRMESCSRVSHVDNLMFIIGSIRLINFQRLIALKVLSIEDFDGLEALLECLESIAYLQVTC